MNDLLDAARYSVGRTPWFTVPARRNLFSRIISIIGYATDYKHQTKGESATIATRLDIHDAPWVRLERA